VRESIAIDNPILQRAGDRQGKNTLRGVTHRRCRKQRPRLNSP
jgi:hypothetical protein